MATDRLDGVVRGRTTISTVKLEGLIVDSVLLEKMGKVIEDPNVTMFRTHAGAIYQNGPKGEDAAWNGYTVEIEGPMHGVKQAGPRKDWRHILNKALTLWIEDSRTTPSPS